MNRARLPLGLEEDMLSVSQDCELYKHPRKDSREKKAVCMASCLQHVQKCKRPRKNHLPTSF